MSSLSAPGRRAASMFGAGPGGSSAQAAALISCHGRRPAVSRAAAFHLASLEAGLAALPAARPGPLLPPAQRPFPRASPPSPSLRLPVPFSPSSRSVPPALPRHIHPLHRQLSPPPRLRAPSPGSRARLVPIHHGLCRPRHVSPRRRRLRPLQEGQDQVCLRERPRSLQELRKGHARVLSAL